MTKCNFVLQELSLLISVVTLNTLWDYQTKYAFKLTNVLLSRLLNLRIRNKFRFITNSIYWQKKNKKKPKSVPLFRKIKSWTKENKVK